MADFRTMMTRGLLLTLFIVGIVSLTATLTSNNGNNDLFAEDPNLNDTLNNLSSSLEDAQNDALNQSLAQDESKPIAVFDFLFESIIGTGKIFKAVLSTMYNVTFGYLSNRLGVPPAVLYTITAIWLMSMILWAWKLFKTGS